MDRENDYNNYFRKMYSAHETIANIGERIDRLYESATRVNPANDGMPKASNPQRLENTICEIADLRTNAETLLKQRARFDLFICSIAPAHKTLLDLKFEDGLSWKIIAGELGVSITSAKQSYKAIKRGATDFGCFRPILSVNA